MDAHTSEGHAHLAKAAEIVSAYVTRNALPASELPAFIADVYRCLSTLARRAVEPIPAAPVPAVPIKRSVTDEYIICLEDGKKFRSLRRHLSAAFDLTPQQYREKWKLPLDYPMVAPAYSSTRSELAKQAGLGQKSQAWKRKPAKKVA